MNEWNFCQHMSIDTRYTTEEDKVLQVAAMRAKQSIKATVKGGTRGWGWGGGVVESILNVRNKFVPVCCEAFERRLRISLWWRTSLQRRWGTRLTFPAVPEKNKHTREIRERPTCDDANRRRWLWVCATAAREQYALGR